MPRCCGQSGCSCVVSAGTGVTVTGSGSSADPFVISSAAPIAVADNTTFDLTLTAGTLSVNYAATAKLDDLPDVSAPAPTNAQVLGWDNSLQRWTPRAPTTAASGSVLHDTSVTGDGSAGTPLAVRHDPTRGTGTFTGGVGLTDGAINQTVRAFLDATARAAASPAPDLNTLSMLDTAPGEIDYFDGTSWFPVLDRMAVQIVGSEFLALSGSYTAGLPITEVIKVINTSTDGTGVFDVLDPTDLTGRAGVLMVQFQETGSSLWSSLLFANTDRVSGYAYDSLGNALLGQSVTGMIYAWVY